MRRLSPHRENHQETTGFQGDHLLTVPIIHPKPQPADRQLYQPPTTAKVGPLSSLRPLCARRQPASCSSPLKKMRVEEPKTTGCGRAVLLEPKSAPCTSPAPCVRPLRSPSSLSPGRAPHSPEAAGGQMPAPQPSLGDGVCRTDFGPHGRPPAAPAHRKQTALGWECRPEPGGLALRRDSGAAHGPDRKQGAPQRVSVCFLAQASRPRGTGAALSGPLQRRDRHRGLRPTCLRPHQNTRTRLRTQMGLTPNSTLFFKSNFFLLW